MEEIAVFLNEYWEVVLVLFAIIAILVGKSKLLDAIKNLLERIRDSKKSEGK